MKNASKARKGGIGVQKKKKKVGGRGIDPLRQKEDAALVEACCWAGEKKKP